VFRYGFGTYKVAFSVSVCCHVWQEVYINYEMNKILIIEDEQRVADLLRRGLEEMGYPYYFYMLHLTFNNSIKIYLE
jgi:hypothetical protein